MIDHFIVSFFHDSVIFVFNLYTHISNDYKIYVNVQKTLNLYSQNIEILCKNINKNDLCCTYEIMSKLHSFYFRL